MRIGIIAANNLRYSPYIIFYTHLFKKYNITYELIIPNRNDVEESFDSALHVFPWHSKLPVLINYYIYSNRVKRIVQEENYDFLVVLTGNNAAFLGLWLKKHYKNRYIIDIRDYSHENIYPYFLLEKIAVENSRLNIISSRKFTSFLPTAEYCVCHNCPNVIKKIFTYKQGKTPISIGYVGSINYVEQCMKLMELVANDTRFCFEFYGTSPMEKVLQDKAKIIKCKRIVFHGGYAPEEKGNIIQKVDILFNAYGNGCALLDYALSNKLYDAYLYVKPILTSPGTYMSEMAGPLSFELDFDKPDILNCLYAWYTQIDARNVELFALQKLQDIVKENEKTIQKIRNVILEGQ